MRSVRSVIRARSIASTAASSLSVMAPSAMIAVELRRTAIGSALRAPNADSAWLAAAWLTDRSAPTCGRRLLPARLLRLRLRGAGHERILGGLLQRRRLAGLAADEAIDRRAGERGVLGEVLEGAADAGGRHDRHQIAGLHLAVEELARGVLHRARPPDADVVVVEDQHVDAPFGPALVGAHVRGRDRRAGLERPHERQRHLGERADRLPLAALERPRSRRR